MTARLLLRVACLLTVAALPVRAQTVRDSAGIRIIDNAKPMWAFGDWWRLSDVPMFKVGAEAGHELGRIAAATRLSDGRVVVMDESTMQLKYYDATGRFFKTAGGKGRGPGEFTEVSTVMRLPGDSIAVDGFRGTSIFAPNGAYVRSVPFGPFPQGLLETPIVAALGRFDNGTTVVGDYPQGRVKPPGAKRWVDSSTLLLLDKNGGMARNLGKIPAAILVDGPQHASSLDFGPDAPRASNGRELYLGFTDQYAIRVYDANWKLDRIIRRAWTPQKLTDRDLDTYVDGWMAMWSKATGAERDAERKKMREDDYAEFLPAFATMLVAPTGELWVRAPDLTGAPGCWCTAGMPTVASHWSVFEKGGRWLGDVTMPARFVPLEIGSDYVLGKSRDVDDLPYATMYRIVKPK